MLQSLRDNTRGLVAGILIGLLVIIFALAGSEALFSNFIASSNVVSVNGEDITDVDISRAVNSQRQQMINMYGDSLPPEFLSEEYLREPALDTLVVRTVLTQAARDAGMTVSDQRVNQIIVSDLGLSLEDGSFDRLRYQQFLRTQGFTPTTFRVALENDILINQLASGITQSGFVTQGELERIIALSEQKRDFNYVVIDADDIRANLEISEEDIESYYNSNLQAFTQPDKVAVDYIELSVDGLVDSAEVPEAQIRRQYEQEVANFMASIQRRAAHILIESNDSERIAEIQNKLAEGVDFAELAREYSDDLGSRDDGGDLGYTTGDAFPEAFEQALVELEVGDVSGPVRTEAGIHLIKLLDERGAEPPSYEEEKQRLAQLLRRVEAESRFAGLLDRLRDLSFNAENLGEVADELGLEVVNTGLFPRSGGEGLASRTPFISASFSEEVLEDNNASDVIEFGSDRVVVLKKTDFQASYVQPLDDVHDQVVELVREQQVRALVAQQGDELKSVVTEQGGLTSAADDRGLNLRVAAGISRNDVGVERDIVRHVFSLSRPSANPVIGGGHLGNGDYVVIELSAVHDGSLDDQEPEVLAALQARLSQSRASEAYNSFQAILRSQAKIRQ